MRNFPARALRALCAAALLAGPAFAQGPAASRAPADPLPARPDFSPPWQHGANNDAVPRGLTFTVPQVDVLADFHGDPFAAKLVLYVGGNYFFAMAPLVHAFEAANPGYAGRIYFETIPPGLLVQQMAAGGRITVGNMSWTAKPDAYFAGLMKVRALIASRALAGPAVAYVTNRLTIMIRKDNPAHITGLADLGRPGLRLVMPNPAYEGIARQIRLALTRAGGAALATRVYDTKVADGSTILTRVHHRQTPLALMEGLADAGVTWQSEARFQEQAGHPISHIAIPDADNATAIYAGAAVAGAPHPQAARAWLAFIHSPAALRIFARYGFIPYSGQ